MQINVFQYSLFCADSVWIGNSLKLVYVANIAATLAYKK